MLKITNQIQVPLSPGERLIYIRQVLLGLSRAGISKKYKIKVDTLYNWESGRNAITHKVLDRYLPCLKQEGIIVEKDWIMHGSGEKPIKAPHFIKIDHLQTTAAQAMLYIPEQILMPKEVSAFVAYHPNAICMHVDTDDMRPYYAKNDYVCGILTSSVSELQSLVGYNCIIFLQKERCIIRHIQSVNEDGTFNLVSFSSTQSDTELVNIEIVSAAEILLHRKQRGALKSALLL